jgi:tetratricopeptide (TPR) repeat protein
LRGRQQEGAEAFAQAARALHDRVEEPNLVLAKVIARQGAYSRFIGRLDEAKALLEESLEMARALDEKREIAFSLYNLGAADPANVGAEEYWQESLSLVQEIGHRALQAETLNWLAFASYHQGDSVAAVKLLEKSLDLRRTLEDQRGLAIGLTNLGVIYIHLGDYDSAGRLMQEALQTYRQLNDLHGMAAACNKLSHIAINTQNYKTAKKWGEQALTYFREVGDKKAEGEALGNLGEVALYQQDYEGSRSICWQCIKLYKGIGLSASPYYSILGRVALAQDKYEEAQQMFQQALQEEPNPPLTLDILAGIASVWAQTGELERAIAALTFVEQHAASERFVKERVKAQLTELEKTLPPEQFVTAQTKSEQKSLAKWVEWVQQKRASLGEGPDI